MLRSDRPPTLGKLQLGASVKSTDARSDPVSLLDIDRRIETSLGSEKVGMIERDFAVGEGYARLHVIPRKRTSFRSAQ